MFPDLLHRSGRAARPGHRSAFVRGVSVRKKRNYPRRVERLILVSWALIAVKSVLVWWACEKYAVPINPLWVIVPTVMMAALTTAIFYSRR
jgi:hypothetical protein